MSASLILDIAKRGVSLNIRLHNGDCRQGQRRLTIRPVARSLKVDLELREEKTARKGG